MLLTKRLTIRIYIKDRVVEHLVKLRQHYKSDPNMHTSSEDSDDAVNYGRAALKQLRSKEDSVLRLPSHIQSAAFYAASTVLLRKNPCAILRSERSGISQRSQAKQSETNTRLSAHRTSFNKWFDFPIIENNEIWNNFILMFR